MSTSSLSVPRPERPSVRGATLVAWDLPTRLFKWSLVALIALAWISSGFNDPSIAVHKATGYGILTLLIYRILWGFAGGTTARFSTFVKAPGQVAAYLRSTLSNRQGSYLGHNPAGGLVVVGLILVCGIQVGLGLVASDGVLASGPFAERVGESMSNIAGSLHGAWFYVILGLAAVHIVANLFHQFVKRDNLIGAMITGRKPVAAYVDSQYPRQGSLLNALSCLCVAAALVFFGVTWSGGQFFG